MKLSGEDKSKEKHQDKAMRHCKNQSMQNNRSTDKESPGDVDNMQTHMSVTMKTMILESI